MTTYQQNRKRRKASHNPVFPYCGKHRDRSGNEWSPATIKKHERGCTRCQEIKETRLTVLQSEYRTKRKASVAQYIADLPFDDDE